MKKPSGITNRVVFTNTSLNLLGKILPLLVALITIPILIKQMGVERFGILSLAWMIIGYFGIFDLGVGRATTKFVAEYLTLNKIDELPPLIWTSICLLFGFGLLTGISIYFLSPWLVEKVFNISPILREETLKSFQIMAIFIPVVMSSLGLRGILEAQQRFGLINMVKVQAGLANFLCPLLVLPFSTSLYPIISILAGVRLVVLLVFFLTCLKSLPGMTRFMVPSVVYVKELLFFGGWLTISKIIYPLMMNMDRFFIGAMLTMEAVTYYSTPFEILTRLYIIPGSLVPVLFPAFTAYTITDKDKLVSMYKGAFKGLLLFLTPIIVCIIVFAQPFLKMWLGPEFAQTSSPVMQWLAVGFLLGSIGQVPDSAIQAMGRPDLTAKIHLLELPFFVGLIWLALKTWGLTGLALTWTLRQGINIGLLVLLARGLMPKAPVEQPLPWITLGLSMSGVCLGIYFLAVCPNVMIKITLFPVILITLFFLAWRYFLVEPEREFVYLTKQKLFSYLG